MNDSKLGSRSRARVQSLLQTLLRTLHLTWKVDRRGFISLGIANALLAVLPLVSVELTQRIVSTATEAKVTETIALVLINATVLVAGTALRSGQLYTSQLFATRVGYHAERQVLSHIIQSGPGIWEDPQTSVAISRARSAASGHRFTMPVSQGMSLASQLVQLTSMAIYVATISPWLACVLALMSVPLLVAPLFFRRREYEFDRDTTRVQLAVGYWRNVLTRDALAELESNDGLGLVLTRWEGAFQNEVRRLKRSLQIQLGGVTTSEALMAIAYATCALILVRATVPGAIPKLVAGLQAITFCASVLVSIGPLLSSLADTGWRIMEAAPWLERTTHDDTANVSAIGSALTRRLELCGVSFQYPTRDTLALECVSLQLDVGQLYTVAGSNGAGKTTLIRCILGQLAPSAGLMLVDGQPFARSPAWDSTVAYVPQRLVHLDVTLREYLTLGASVADSEIMRALETVGAEWARTDLDKPLGYTGHAGTQISTGQRQMLGLARVFLRPHIRLVVLDEPYTGLDSDHATRLWDCCHILKDDRLVLMVAHRFEMVTAADQVIWIHDGRILAQGPPRILDRQESYRRFWRLDA